MELSFARTVVGSRPVSASLALLSEVSMFDLRDAAIIYSARVN
jgi:hypothetical protein